MNRTDLDLPQRLYEVLKRSGETISWTEVAAKFQVRRDRVNGLLAEYVNRGYLDRKNVGHGSCYYTRGPVDPDVVKPMKVKREHSFDDIEAFGYDEIPLERAGASKYDKVFAKLVKPGLCVALPVEITEAIRTAIRRRHMRSRERYTTRRVGVNVNLYRLPDSEAPKLRRVA